MKRPSRTAGCRRHGVTPWSIPRAQSELLRHRASKPRPPGAVSASELERDVLALIAYGIGIGSRRRSWSQHGATGRPSGRRLHVYGRSPTGAVGTAGALSTPTWALPPLPDRAYHPDGIARKM